MALQNVVDQTQAIHTLKAKEVSIRPTDLAFLSPYASSKLKRFGEYPTDMKPDAMPNRTTLKIEDLGDVAAFYTNLTDGPFTPVMEQQLVLAGARLAALLNRLLQ